MRCGGTVTQMDKGDELFGSSDGKYGIERIFGFRVCDGLLEGIYPPGEIKLDLALGIIAGFCRTQVLLHPREVVGRCDEHP